MNHLRLVPLAPINHDAAERTRTNVVSIEKRAAMTKRMADELEAKAPKGKGCPNAFAAFVIGIMTGFVMTAFGVASYVASVGAVPGVWGMFR